MAKIKPLKENRLFKDFSDKDIAILSQIVSEKTIPKNTPLYVEQMMGEALFIVKSGSVQISKSLPGAGNQVVSRLGPGETFGELALLDGGPRLVSARSEEATELLVIESDDLRTLAEKEPATCLKFLMAVMRAFVHRLRDNLPLAEEFLRWRLKGVAGGGT